MSLLAQDTVFNYQGRLNANGSPVTGWYDMVFALYDSASGGNQVEKALTNSAVEVDQGFFNVSLDFGAAAFNGERRYLSVGVKSNGVATDYTWLSPRQSVLGMPYAIRARVANSAINIMTGAVSSNSIGTGVITAEKVADGQLVKSINGLFDNIVLSPGIGMAMQNIGNTITLDNSFQGWALNGNESTGGSNFLGTIQSYPMELRSFNRRSLWFNYDYAYRSYSGSQGNLKSVNWIAGESRNTIDAGVMGGTISGGGAVYEAWLGSSWEQPNRITGDFGVVGGGHNNTAGQQATVPGGAANTATGVGSFAAGRQATASHEGSFVWCDGAKAQNSTVENSFEVAARGGARFYLENEGMYLSSAKGVALNNADGPLITRGWDAFNASAGSKSNLGRWGLFMEPNRIVVGMPGDDVPFSAFEVSKYERDGMRQTLMTVEQNGRLTCQSITILGGADLAEPFAMSETNIQPGSVVVIDSSRPGRLKLSTMAYDRKVAGVVSGANGITPGINMIQKEVLEGGLNVALSGRVYVLVDAALGPVEPGDMLTTSPTPGHAMKVADYAKGQGAVLGKAMGQLKAGKGLVLVLVSLQ